MFSFCFISKRSVLNILSFYNISFSEFGTWICRVDYESLGEEMKALCTDCFSVGLRGPAAAEFPTQTCVTARNSRGRHHSEPASVSLSLLLHVVNVLVQTPFFMHNFCIWLHFRTSCLVSGLPPCIGGAESSQHGCCLLLLPTCPCRGCGGSSSCRLTLGTRLAAPQLAGIAADVSELGPPSPRQERYRLLAGGLSGCTCFQEASCVSLDT